MRAVVATLLELVGLAFVVAGAALAWPPAGLLAAGAGLLWVAQVQAGDEP
jgi:hypothetical protein